MYLGSILQIIVAGGLLNVWLLRQSRATKYRGGESSTLKQEFATYGLPEVMYYIVGFLKVMSAVALIISFWVPFLKIYAASLVVCLMVGALLMHLKVKDPLQKSIPALFMLAMSSSIIYLSLSIGA